MRCGANPPHQPEPVTWKTAHNNGATGWPPTARSGTSDRADPLEMTEVLVIAAASAVAAGLRVMIDLDPDTASDDLVTRRPPSAATATCLNGHGGPVKVVGAGYVRLTTRDANWTIDLAQGRLCRSDDAIEPHFVTPDDWTSVQALWVTQTSVTALTDDGTYLSTRSAWTTQHRPVRLAPA